jgi:hypothetical protein
MTTEITAYEGWAVVELMGHVRMAGRVSEAPMFGTALLRIDIPNGDSYTTQFASGGSIYRLTPCSEEVARAIAHGGQPMPIEPWELKRIKGPRPIDLEEQRLREAGYDSSEISGHSDDDDEDTERDDAVRENARIDEPFVPDPRD